MTEDQRGAPSCRPAVEQGTAELISLFGEISGRYAKYNTEVLHNRYMEILGELLKRAALSEKLPTRDDVLDWAIPLVTFEAAQQLRALKSAPASAPCVAVPQEDHALAVDTLESLMVGWPMNETPHSRALKLAEAYLRLADTVKRSPERNG